MLLLWWTCIMLKKGLFLICLLVHCQKQMKVITLFIASVISKSIKMKFLCIRYSKIVIVYPCCWNVLFANSEINHYKFTKIWANSDLQLPLNSVFPNLGPQRSAMDPPYCPPGLRVWPKVWHTLGWHLTQKPNKNVTI